MKIFSKIKQKIQKKINNQGSSIIMVIVALGFLAVIVAALLSSAVYVYKLKLQELNSRNNFYYVEQAMQEIYAGVGAHTIDEMKEAYSYTVENMVYYDTSLHEYVTLDNNVANKLFKDKFMQNIKNSDYFKQGADKLAEILESYISNETVDLDSEKLSVNIESDRIVIKDVTLTRIQNYDNQAANGTYIQTISADIVISEPDFVVTFNQIQSDYPEIFDFALVADMGVEITQGASDPLNIVGDIYASADFYNKGYDTGLTQKPGISNGVTLDGTKVKSTSNNKLYYDFVSVTSKDETATDQTGYVLIDPTSGTADTNGKYNYNVAKNGVDTLTYDGINTRSANSGFYISNTSVSILTEKMIIPGTIAVMDKGSLSVFGGGSKDEYPEIWADNFVLGGSSTSKEVTKTVAGKAKTVTEYSGAQAYIKADMYIRDDTELNAKGSSFTLRGAYYGYGNATSKDDRSFGPMVNQVSFIIEDASGNKFNRGHYNSSSIVLNGDGSALDFTNVTSLYLAGRTYLELSKKDTATGVYDDDKKETTYTHTVVYRPTTTDGTTTKYIRDYETAESLSIKSNQLMYDVTCLGQLSTHTDLGENYNCIELTSDAQLYAFFEDFFPQKIFGHKVLCTYDVIDGVNYCFIDFESAYNIMNTYRTVPAPDPLYMEKAQKAREVLDNTKTAITTDIMSLDEFKIKFVEAYTYAITPNDPTDSTDKHNVEALKDITKYDGFEVGDVLLAEALNASPTDADTKADVYSSGAITTKSGTEFTFYTDLDNTTFLSQLLDTEPTSGTVIPTALTSEFEAKYLRLKWNLKPYEGASEQLTYINDVKDKLGEDDITPINKYVRMGTINRNLINYDVGGNKVWISNDTVTVTGASDISGIIITKGDVVFASDVKNFQGLIIAGGKVYIANGLDSISASPTTCRAIMRTCMASSDEDLQYILKVFKQYEDYEVATTTNATTSDAASIDAIDYTDVVSFENWMKNLGGDYDADKKSSLTY